MSVHTDQICSFVEMWIPRTQQTTACSEELALGDGGVCVYVYVCVCERERETLHCVIFFKSSLGDSDCIAVV